MRVVVLCFASGKYRPYAVALGESLPLDWRFFMPMVPQLPWPYSTMMRFHFYREWLRELRSRERVDFILAMDADLKAVQPLDPLAMYGETVGTLHPGFTGRHAKPGTFEDRPPSACYVAPEARRAYFAGGLVAGTPAGFAGLCDGVVRRIDADLKAGIIPRWHDESALNAHFAEHPPAKVLDPTYLTPEGTDWYGDTSEARILALSKDHAALRT